MIIIVIIRRTKALERTEACIAGGCSDYGRSLKAGPTEDAQ
jgi:hypothetical protein